MAKIRDHIRDGLDQAEAIASQAPVIRRDLDQLDRAERIARGVNVEPIEYRDPEPELAPALFGNAAGFIERVFVQTNKTHASGGTVMGAWANRCVERGLAAYSGSGGGFLSPEVFSAELWDKIRSVDGPLARVRNIVGTPTVPGSINVALIPVIDETTIPADGVSGFSLLFENEGDNSAADQIADGSFGVVRFEPRRARFYARVSNDLREDSPMLGRALELLSAEGMRAGIEDLLIRGPGNGVPHGITTAPATVQVTRTTGSTIVTADVRKMRRALWPFSWRNGPVWHCLPETVEVLEELADSHGAPLYRQQDSGPARLLGWPVLPHPSCGPLGTAGDLLLADWSQYLFYSVGHPPKTPGGPATPMMRVGVHNRFSTDETDLRWLMYIDGRPGWKQSVVPPRATSGTERQSPFACLN